MNPFTTRAGFRVIVVLVAMAIPTIAAVEIHDPPPPIEVFVLNRPHFVPRSTTFGQALKAFHVKARDGRLLDVERKVLRWHAYLGEVLLNGQAVPWRTRLHDRDRIWVVNRPDPVD